MIIDSDIFPKDRYKIHKNKLKPMKNYEFDKYQKIKQESVKEVKKQFVPKITEFTMKIPMKELFQQMNKQSVNSHYYNKGNKLLKSESLLQRNPHDIRERNVDSISYFGEFCPDEKKKRMSLDDLRR